MICWSCGKPIPENAKRCRHCEAEVEPEPTEEEIDAVKGLLADMDPDVLAQLQATFQQSESGEEFVNRIMVGDCPGCGSSNTRDCGSDAEIDDICTGRCFDCGQLWCLDCDQVFAEGQTSCDRCNP